MSTAHANPSSAFESFLDTKRFGSLDGLRCFAILGVLWHHSGIKLNFHLFERGQLSVHLFFAVSGFLITTLMIRERRKFGEISLGKFYMRRSLRIFPLYYAVILIYVVAVAAMEQGTAEGKAFFDNLTAYVTYTSNWFVDLETRDRVIFYFAWSLAVEEQFYLTWPWIERFVKQRLKIALLLVFIGIVFANHLGGLQWLLPAESLGHRIVWNVAPGILFGVLVAHVMHHPTGFAILYRIFGYKWSAPMVLLILLGFASLEPGGQVLEYVIYLCLVGLVVSCTIRESNGLATILSFKLFVRMGMVSYGMYLMHMLCLNATRLVLNKLGMTNEWLILFTTIFVTYGTAEASFHTFERFFQNVKSRYARS